MREVEHADDKGAEKGKLDVGDGDLHLGGPAQDDERVRLHGGARVPAGGDKHGGGDEGRQCVLAERGQQPRLLQHQLPMPAREI